MSVNQLENVAPQPEPSTGNAEPTPVEKKYGGDMKKINDGYWNLNQELTRKNEALSQALPRLQQLEAVVGALLTGGQSSQPTDPASALAEELGLASPESLKSGLRSEVESVLTELFGPFIQQMSADEELSTEIPNFEQLRGETRSFMKDNAEVAETFNAVRGKNPKAAWKYAIREMLIAKNQVQPSPQGASLPGSAAPAGRGAPQPAVNQAQVEAEAAEYGRQYGDMRPYSHERYKGTSIQRAVQRALQQAGHTIPNEGW